MYNKDLDLEYDNTYCIAVILSSYTLVVATMFVKIVMLAANKF